MGVGPNWGDKIVGLPFLSVSLKTRIKGQVKHLRQQYVRVFHGFGQDEFVHMLQTLGIAKGDIIMVHSSFDRFEGFEGKPSDVIATVQAAVGEEGGVLMPTIPFAGTAVEYARTAGVFDVTRTPSRMGLITEIFRRMPDVVRSIHPTHSVAAWGRDSRALIQDHYAAGTPCGMGSPFGRLPKVGGKILLLGAEIDAMTFFHFLEEELEPLMPFSPFTKEIFVMTSRDREGRSFETKTRLFDPLVSRRRNLQKLVPVLKERGVWREARVGTLRGIALMACEVSESCRAMAEEGMYCYD